ncbi:ornithine carbamoyltransferase, partial [Pelagibacteraceae bacterium]|nr:ornithine carbamoyltransferase [Pelagibacteraceae bacterium]
MKNFLNISDLSAKDLRLIIDQAKSRKTSRKGFNKSSPDLDKPFEGKSIVMIFEKPSTRTRISFDIAVKQLGGSSIILNPEGIHYGKGDESIKDTAKVLSEYADIIMIRTANHKNLEEFSKHLRIPIINGLSDQSHPCQIMSDILTFEEVKG